MAQYDDPYNIASHMSSNPTDMSEQERIMKQQFELAQRLRGAAPAQQRNMSFMGNLGRAGTGIASALRDYQAEQARQKADALRKRTNAKIRADEEAKHAKDREKEEFKRERETMENMDLIRSQGYGGPPPGYGTGITSNVNTGSQPWYDDDEDQYQSSNWTGSGGGGDDY